MNWEKKILHLGLGRFHRGHQAVYYQRLSDLTGENWGVVSLSMRSPGARDELRKVQCSYPVLELSAGDRRVVQVESIREVLDLHEDFHEVIRYFCDPQIEIITLTITEKGYCLRSDGSLDLTHTQIKKDFSHPEKPDSAIGLLAFGLMKRMDAISKGITILSCDNLRENGHKLKHALYDYLKAAKMDYIILWLEENASFPNTMVDRIVPSLTPSKTQEFESTYGLPMGSQLIATETFSQWVVEDNFKGKRPPLEKVGVEFVNDVKPFEEMKLRLLNASHSYLAYAGILKGHQFVHEAISDQDLRSDVETLMLNEVSPLLQKPSGFDINQYCTSLIERFRNNKLPHQLRQIAMDGSQKIPQRILPSLIEAHNKGSEKDVLIKAVSVWLRFLLLEKNNKIDDPCEVDFKQTISQDSEKSIRSLLDHNVFKSLVNLPQLKEQIISQCVQDV